MYKQMIHIKVMQKAEMSVYKWSESKWDIYTMCKNKEKLHTFDKQQKETILKTESLIHQVLPLILNGMWEDVGNSTWTLLNPDSNY